MTWNGHTSIRAWEIESGQPIKIRLEGIEAHEEQMAATRGNFLCLRLHLELCFSYF